MAVYTEAIQKLYVAYFNRPADYEGLNYWEKVVEAAHGDISAVAAAFAKEKEYADTYAGMSNMQIVAAVYKNLFNESNPDLAGVDFWTNALNTGAMTINDVVTQIAKGAQGTHAETYVAKVAAATAFTAALDTTAEVLGYKGTAANLQAKTWLSSINKSTLDAAITSSAINATVGTVTNPPIKGQTFVMGQGLDTIVGTTANDTINAFAFNNVTGANTTTLQSVDSIDGGAGNDVLYIEVKDADGAGAGTDNLNGTITGTISNVETIQIDNTQANAAGMAAVGAVVASTFAGATTITQISQAVDIGGLAAGTTAGFKGVTATVGADLDVTAASTATTASIALDGVKGDMATDALAGTTQNRADIDVAGSKLAGVTVTGTLAKANTAAGTSTASLGLNVTLGKDVQSATVNSAVRTTLTIDNAAGSTKDLWTVDASASAGNITYTTADTAVRTIKTGAGADTVTIQTATAVDDASTTTVDETISAFVDAGAGNDTINVNNNTVAGKTTIEAGDGSDTVNIAATAANITVNGGAGDDSFVFARGVGAKDVVNGGEGHDYIDMKGTSLIAQDYEILRAVVTGVEGLSFADAITAADASKLTQFSEFMFNTGANTISKLADTQSIIAFADVTASTAGYVSSANGATYAGTVSAYVEGGTAGDTVNLAASGEKVVLDVAASAAWAGGAGVATYASLTGDVKSATVSLTNSVNAAIGSTATADVLANFTLTTSNAAAGDAYTANGAMTSLVLTGNGAATVTNNTGSKLASIDASGMTGKAAFDATVQVGGLTFTAQDALAETVKLGGGKDAITTTSTYTKMDTISGLTLVADANGDLATAKSDDITVGIAGTVYAKTTVTGATLGLALTDAAAKAGNALVFQYGGDTYIFMDNNNTALDASNTVGTFGQDDVVVKLVGLVDLDLLVQALNA